MIMNKKIGGSTVVGVDNAQIKQKIQEQQQHQLKKFLGLWPNVLSRQVKLFLINQLSAKVLKNKKFKWGHES